MQILLMLVATSCRRSLREGAIFALGRKKTLAAVRAVKVKQALLAGWLNALVMLQDCVYLIQSLSVEEDKLFPSSIFPCNNKGRLSPPSWISFSIT